MRILCILFLVLSLPKIASTRSIDSIYFKERIASAISFQKSFQPKASLKILNNLLPKAKKYFTPKSKEIGTILYNIASCKLDLASYKEAKNYLDQSLEIFSLIDSVSVELGDTYMLIGIYYDYMTEYDKALAYYELTKAMYLKLFSPDHYRFGYLYNNIGICIFYKGDIERALTFFNKTLAITIESLGKKSVKTSRDLTNLGQVQSRIKKPKMAVEKLTYSLELAKQNKVINSFIGARIYHALSLAYYEMTDYKNALVNLKIAYNIRSKHLPENHDEIASNYFMIANVFEKQGKIEKAKIYFQKSLAIYSKIFNDQHPEIATIYTSLGSILLNENKLKPALEYLNKALIIFEYDENVSPTNSDVFNLNILKALDLKAQVLQKLWIKEKNILYLKKADRIYADLIYILNDFRKGFKEDVSKELLAEDYFYVFDDAIEVSYLLFEETKKQYHLENAFEYCEYSSSFVLLEERRNAKAKNIAEIPDSLLLIEQKLKLDIAFLEKKKREEVHQEQPDQNKIVKLESQIFDLKEDLYIQVQKIEKKFPRYFSNKYDLSPISIPQLQSNTISSNQALVEYFVGEKNIFVFIITKEKFIVEKIEKTFPLENWIEELRKKITKFQYPFNLADDYHNQLVEYAEGLYWETVSPVENHFKQRITIVPGGPLAEVPFECFIKKTASNIADYKNHRYLAHDYAISYSYSGTLLNEMVNNRIERPNNKSIAFAPSFSDFGKSSNLRDLLLLPLEYNISEVENISRMIGAKTVIGDKATEEFFINQAKDYNIIHFASHAKADKQNSDYSFLAFTEIQDSIENELLYVNDIYNIPFQSDMVTLSACQTGIGENKKGEGVISLARSFSFSGTCNINTSLWNVSDDKTADLMKSFYKNISEGFPKDEAMQKAKLNFISRQDDNMQVHPFFWTPMISIGDMRPLEIESNINLPLWLGTGALLLVLGIYFYFRKSIATN